MKSKLFFLFLLFAVVQNSFAQDIHINTYGGYVFDESFDLSDVSGYYNGTINGGFQWGAGFEFMANKQYGVEMSYLRQDTKAPVRKNGSSLINNYNLGINYILAGGNRYIKTANKNIEPYAGGQFGMAIFNIEKTDGSSKFNKTKFAWGIKTGANIHASERIGIKLQAQLLSTVQGLDGGFYFGTGGSGTSLSARSSILQFGFTGGLVFVMPSHHK
jgi:hypothetical protein